MRVICLISVLASGACAPAPAVSLEGADLIATFAADDSATLTIAFAGANVVGDGDSGVCPTIASDGITFAGKALPDGDVSSGGGTSGACEPIGITTVVAGKDPPEDAELVINSGGATVRWIATNLLATRRFLRAGDPLDQVPRGSIVRVNHEPITDVLGDPEAVTLTDDAELALNFRLDEDGIVVDIPLGATPGPQTLDVSVPIEVPTVTCEGFASCLLASTHFQQIPITVSP